MILGITICALLLAGLTLLAWALSYVLGALAWILGAAVLCLGAALALLGHRPLRAILREGLGHFWRDRGRLGP